MRYPAPTPPARGPRRAPLASGHLRVSALATSIALVCGGGLAADDVHLHNGSVFEDVVAEVTDTHVVVELAIGRLRFPVEQVREVVRSGSALADFHDRREVLLRDPSSPSGSWVELASWARVRGLERAWRETTLFAARLDATAPGLEPLMHELGYERDAELGWLRREEAMRRRGLVEYQGSWIAPERVAELRTAERAERDAASVRGDGVPASRRERSRGAAPTDNEVALASLELAREVVRSTGDAAEQVSPRPRVPIFVAGWPLAVGGITPASPEARAAWDALATRQPGSIIPLETFRRQLDR